ncbi:PREDICTED: zinc finger protein 227-like [Dufourea novaeangliae]|uniref:zinc finger protein 227-like n=1 Tax=Dufourea novaeangliae TaxID=178035 RepID=UPI000767423E|nr:PREDICTED: zinc finger protein 227-like [Dufourea novaeangliae]
MRRRGSEEEPLEYDALWMLEKKARSIGDEAMFQDRPYRRRRQLTDLGQPEKRSYKRDPLFVAVEQSYATHYVCTDCGKGYRRMDSLKRHKRVDCGNKEKQFSCDLCDKKFKYRYSLKHHVTMHHAIVYILVPFHWPIIVTVSASPADVEGTPKYDPLWMLEKKTQGIGNEPTFQERPYRSTTIRHSTESRQPEEYSYRVEPLFVAVEQTYATHYVCTDCGRGYKWLDSLKRHQRVECGNKEKKFSCDLCDKKYKYRYLLKHHITVHHAT